MWFLTEELRASIWLLRYCNLAPSVKMPTPFIQMPAKLKAGGNMHKKSHLIAHIAYIGLYGMLIISTIIHYNSADLAELLYTGWIIIAFGIIFFVLFEQITGERACRRYRTC